MVARTLWYLFQKKKLNHFIYNNRLNIIHDIMRNMMTSKKSRHPNKFMRDSISLSLDKKDHAILGRVQQLSTLSTMSPNSV